MSRQPGVARCVPRRWTSGGNGRRLGLGGNSRGRDLGGSRRRRGPGGGNRGDALSDRRAPAGDDRFDLRPLGVSPEIQRFGHTHFRKTGQYQRKPAALRATVIPDQFVEKRFDRFRTQRAKRFGANGLQLIDLRRGGDDGHKTCGGSPVLACLQNPVEARRANPRGQCSRARGGKNLAEPRLLALDFARAKILQTGQKLFLLRLAVIDGRQVFLASILVKLDDVLPHVVLRGARPHAPNARRPSAESGLAAEHRLKRADRLGIDGDQVERRNCSQPALFDNAELGREAGIARHR